MVTVAHGLGGLTEISLELVPEDRGRGGGTGLFRAALAAVEADRTVVAAVAPGNAASLRAAVAALFVPVASVQLVRPRW